MLIEYPNRPHHLLHIITFFKWTVDNFVEVYISKQPTYKILTSYWLV